ncbi:class I SAM-dependent methyltransferase [Gracilibacillus sp. S3-1-1]|uniref:Class I SAM-dependent methyltransferase n=1 Tax=Gracilibacillus pellucidus TaxID=3095368 RepID=A0ACC6M824_9BACI|nr:class I SAM-dependent methyltransferase [Gracilibacillus sp. S3-1-1]MDX8047075.1 class I SAM-dependent methyltransferase [Gracilibacillus sp. S3-1-1]
MKASDEKNIIESYNKKAIERDTYSLQDWKVKERDVFLNKIKKEKCGSLLEIGAGTGKDSLYFKEQGLNTISTDISPEMVKLCKEKGLSAKVMNFSSIDFPNNHFDSIWALNCLLHVSKEDIKGALNEIKRVLKPSGLFYMGVYGGENYEGIWEGDSYTPKRFFSFYEDESIKQLLSELFSIDYFNVVPNEIVGGKYHFQSIILRK